MSRQPTWDLACKVQARCSRRRTRSAGSPSSSIYFRGFDECRASKWVIAPSALTKLMTQIDCRGGHTQIGRVLRHVRNEATSAGVKALVYVGDAMEEPVDELCAAAGELALLGVKAFMFHEGPDEVAGNAFQEIARLTGGAYARFDANAPSSLASLLRAAAAYASGGVDALNRLAAARYRRPQAPHRDAGPMITLLYGVGVLAVLWWVSRLFAGANPALVAKRMKQVGGFVALAAAALLAVRGRFDMALMLGRRRRLAPRLERPQPSRLEEPHREEPGLGVAGALRHDRDGARSRHRRHGRDGARRPFRRTLAPGARRDGAARRSTRNAGAATPTACGS